MLDSLMAWTPNATGPVCRRGPRQRPQGRTLVGQGGDVQSLRVRRRPADRAGRLEVKFAANLLEALERERSAGLRSGRRRALGRSRCGLFPRNVPWTDPERVGDSEFEGRRCSASRRCGARRTRSTIQRVAARGMISRDAEGNAAGGTPLVFREEPGRVETKARGWTNTPERVGEDSRRGSSTCSHPTASRSVRPHRGRRLQARRPLPLWGKTIAKRSVGASVRRQGGAGLPSRRHHLHRRRVLPSPAQGQEQVHLVRRQRSVRGRQRRLRRGQGALGVQPRQVGLLPAR